MSRRLDHPSPHVVSSCLLQLSDSLTQAKLVTPEPCELFSQDCFLDATGVLIGQPAGISKEIYSKSSQSWGLPNKLAKPAIILDLTHSPNSPGTQ